jgi:hypothetical protein
LFSCGISGYIYNRVYVLWISQTISEENKEKQQNIPVKGKYVECAIRKKFIILKIQVGGN